MNIGLRELDTFPAKLVAWVYAAVATPILLLLCVLVQPLHGLDEPAHFLRITQLTTGHILPVPGPDGRSTGSIAGQGARDFSVFYGHLDNDYREKRPTSFAELGRLYAIRGVGPAAYITHSNTSIYSPLAYLTQVPSFLVAQRLSDRPLVWMYAARVTAALLGVLMTFLALRYSTRARPLLFLVAMLPITLFQTAVLSADSLLIPSILCLAVILSRILDGASLSVAQCVMATLLAAFIGLGKIAYMPIAIMPPILAFVMSRRIDRTVVMLGAGAAAILLIWLLWSAQIQDLVFTNREDNPDHVDVHRQLAVVLSQPMVFVRAVWATLHPHYLKALGNSFAGGLIGWINILLPRPVLYVNYLLLIATLALDTRARATPWLAQALVYIVGMGGALAIFLMLYLQWNDVGSGLITGVQGRYFLPLLPIVGLVTPVAVLRGSGLRTAAYVLTGWCCFLAVLTPAFVLHFYWGVG